MSGDVTGTFKENYGKLRELAQRVNNQADLDIDQLVPLVEEAASAYKACKARIDEVEKLLAGKSE